MKKACTLLSLILAVSFVSRWTPSAAAASAATEEPATSKEQLVQAIQSLSGKDLDARDKALDLLIGSTYRGHDLVNPLIALLSDPSARVRSQAAKLLGEVGDPKAVAPLLPLAKDTTSRVRRESARALRLLKAREAIPEFLVLVQDRSEEVALEAIMALQMFKDPRAAKPLSEIMINGLTYRLRGAAIQALGDLGSREPVSQMIVLMEYERDIWLRLDLARALAKIGDPEAQTPLMRALESARRDGNQQADPKRKKVYDEIAAELEKALADLKVNMAKPVNNTASNNSIPTNSSNPTTARAVETPEPTVEPSAPTNTAPTNDTPGEDDPFGDDEDNASASSTPTTPAPAHEPAAPTTAKAMPKKGFTIQIKATGNEQEATALVDELKGKGEAAFISEFPKDGATWYRVRVGVFPSKEKAQTYAKGLQDKAVIGDFFISKTP